MSWVVTGLVATVAVLAVLASALGFFHGGEPTPSPRPTIDISLLHPPSATPLTSPPAAPATDGTLATIETDLGLIHFELFTESAPVASENFINLANAGFYDGVVFHRIIPDFMIQGGDPAGTGRGGPGYTIQDEPIVGEYLRGMVAMARTPLPNSQGSQFFIIVKDSPDLSSGNYVIFGRVVGGMDVVDQIVAGPRTGPDDDLAADPVVMRRVIVQPSSSA